MFSLCFHKKKGHTFFLLVKSKPKKIKSFCHTNKKKYTNKQKKIGPGRRTKLKKKANVCCSPPKKMAEYKFSEAQQKVNNQNLEKLISFVPKIRPSMVRRLQRAKPKTQCYLISETDPASLQHVKDMPTSKQPIVSWLVPNTKDANKPFEFCFSVKEVQEFIAQNAPTDDSVSCPMFGQKQMQAVVQKSGIVIDTEMPREFRFVFEEFHLLPYSQETLKEDLITHVALETVEKYVNAGYKEEEKKQSVQDESAFRNRFWKFTKEYLDSGFEKMTNVASKILLFVLGNPWWTTVAKMLAKILRVVICACSSFVGDVTNQGTKILDMLKKQFMETLREWAHGPQLVLEMAKSLLPAFLSDQPLNFKSASENVSKYRLFGTLQKVIGDYIDTIKTACGFSFIMRLPKLVLNDSAAIFERILYVSSLRTFGANLRKFTELDFHFLAMVVLFDVVTTCFQNAVPFMDFALRFLPKSAITEALKTNFKTFATNKQFTWMRLVEYISQNENPEVRRVMGEAMQELYFWIMDVFPCLFQHFVRNVRAFFVFGITAPQDTNASCCLRDVVMSMQKEVVFHGNDRGRGEQAQAANDLASSKLTEKQKKQTWLDYLLRRPFAVDETEEQVAKVNQKEWEEMVTDPVHNAATPSLDDEDGQEGALWAAQCGHDKNHMLPNPVSVDKKHGVPFYFEQAYGSAQDWCVAPNAAHIKQKFPNALWSVGGKQYVLLHNVPNDFVQHMATMQTPVFSFRAI